MSRINDPTPGNRDGRGRTTNKGWNKERRTDCDGSGVEAGCCTE